MIQEIEDGLFDRLAGGTALITALGGTAIYDTMIPSDKSLPAVVYSLNSGGDTNRTQTNEADFTYLVKAIATDQAQAVTIAELIRDRLHDADLTLSPPWTAYRCHHTQVVKFVENVERDPFYHAGGLYRVRATRDP